MGQLFLRIILSATIGLTTLNAGSAGAQDSAAVVRRLSATAHLAAEEYRLGVASGRVVQPEEVAEAKLFLEEAGRTAAKLPGREVSRALAELAAIQALVQQGGSPDSVSAAVGRLLGGLAGRLRVELDEIPPAAPSLARGAEIYQRACASCHGATGRGDGVLAAGLKPPPANLADAARLQDASPLDFYRRITIGVAGTSMPPAEGTLSAEDRWAVAVYASLLRLPAARGEVPAALAAFPSTARMSDRRLREALGAGADLSRVAAVRMVLTEKPLPGGRDYRPVFVRVRQLLDSAYALAQQGKGEDAGAVAMDGYIVFEQVERDLGVKDATLVAEIEAAFAGVRDQAGRGSAASAPALREVRARLAAALERAERTVGDALPPLALFGQSFLILLREGLEAILVVGALIAFVVKTGAARRRRDIHIGVAAAVGMSLLTAAAIETLFRLEPAHQEALEGGTLVAATLVLFYVSYWLISRMEVARWNQFVRGKVADALGRRSGFALAAVAFLAVYREGFETVLFYKALALSGGRGPSWVPISGGIAVGALVLAVVYVAINRFGVRLRLKPFFAVTGGFLYFMAFSFAGKAVAELQEGRLLRLTPVPGGPRLPALGIYPTAESLLAQGVLLLLALVALVWLFLVEPRRRGARAAPGESPAARRAGAPGPDQELVRSLDRIEADLAEVRSELERMRAVVEKGGEVPSERDG